jgi:YaiO family outer membrane protein
MKKGFLIFVIFFLLGALPAVSAQTETTVRSAVSDKTEEERSSKYEVQMNFSVERLTRNLGAWRSASLYVQRTFGNKQIVWANYRVSERRQTRDQEFIFGTYKPFAKKWAFTAEAMYSPTRQYVGKFSVMGEAEKIFKKGFVAHFGGRFTKYTIVNAVTGYGVVEKYWGSNRAAYTLYVTKLSNAGTAPTHRIQYNRYYGERVNSIGAAVSFGREHENLFPEIGILRNDTWSVSLSARHWLTDKFGLNVDGTIHRQGNLYYRRGLSFGIRYRF